MSTRHRQAKENDMTITSRICRVCRTEILRDTETGEEAHRDINYDAACAEIRNGRTEMETVVAMLRSIDQSGSMRNFRLDLGLSQVKSDPQTEAIAAHNRRVRDGS